MSTIHGKCFWCLCQICTGINCPRGGPLRCFPYGCHDGTVYECDFLTRRKVTRVYKIKKRSPALSVDHVRQLRDQLNMILGEYQVEEPVSSGSLHDQLKAEDQRHRAELRRIVREAKEKGK